MKESKVIKVDGRDYTVTPFVTSQGVKLLTDLVRVAGEPLITLAVSLKDHKGSVLEADVTPERISQIMSGLMTRVETDTLDSLFKRVLEGTLIGTTSRRCSEEYDTYFIGDYLHLFKVVAFSIKEQFGAFSAGLGGIVNFAKAVTPK